MNALRIICSRLDGKGLNWALTGSMSFALQGIPVTVHDIDIQTDRPAAYELERLLSEFSVRPVSLSSTGRIQSHFGELDVNGMKVEIMGDIQKRLPDGTWEDPVDLSLHRQVVEVAGMHVPVLSLEYEHRAYLLMGRTERAALLAEYIKVSGGE